MLLLAMKRADHPAAEEVVIVTPEGREIVVRFLGAAHRGTGQVRIGFEAQPDVRIVRRALTRPAGRDHGQD